MSVRPLRAEPKLAIEGPAADKLLEAAGATCPSLRHVLGPYLLSRRTALRAAVEGVVPPPSVPYPCGRPGCPRPAFLFPYSEVEGRVQSTPATTEPTAPVLLEVRGLSKSFRGLQALDGYDLALRQGTIHGVIGPNGAGKTTLFHMLSGFLRPTSGSVRFEGREIAGSPAWRVARLGIGRTFQNIRLFGELSVIDNVKVAIQRQWHGSLVATLFSTPGFRRREAEIDAAAAALLDRVGLAARRDQLARNLPYGDQRRLEVARAVATQPKILLLDEPNAGMNPIETQDLLGLIRRLRDELGITIVLVAHDIPLVMNLCDRIQVLNYGRLIAEGDPAAVRSNPEVIAAYLGQARSA